MGAERRARDLALLDAIDAMPRRPFTGEVWRACREGRDPLLGAASLSRWCNGAFEVLYTSGERDGAVAEVHAYLTLQPVFPSKLTIHTHRLGATAESILDLTDEAALAALGLDMTRYRDRRYERTQAIADAAFFLGFNGLLAPSARWPCRNLVLFTDRIPSDRLDLLESEPEPVDWDEWRRLHRGAGRS